ncbi:uncharacterized protein LOC127289592 [Leptopilina boulardi]|uniref:uncharacterized protein LOC127289592 n=1 Tax=Leptopilina boulardi TaxID=63433 RepID=UPI0021F6349C|nr:uncharacterized protein LOC127289592 [Leptopilina boulardi]
MDLSFIFYTFLIGACHGMIWGPDREDQCENAMRTSFLEDSATTADETPSRLEATWLSQECEVRAGPEYLIRKYLFFPNGTFLLSRYHYADESCTIPTHTVVAHGTIKLHAPSTFIPGVTKTKYLLHTVHVVPLNRQVAHKFEHRVNVTCSPQPKWRPYVAQLVYQVNQRFSNIHWDEGSISRYNQLEGHQSLHIHRGIDCLRPLGIDFGELDLVRVQKKPSSSNAFALGSNGQPQVQLFLAGLPPNRNSRFSHFPSSLQSSPLIRSDMMFGCPICNAVIRSTDSSPPLLNEGVALPALLGGSWLSVNCESFKGGLWIKRQLQVYSGDKLWTGRWDYYTDPKCLSYIYSVTAAGSYVQRAGRQRRHDEIDRYVEENLLPNENKKVESIDFDDFSRMRREPFKSKYHKDFKNSLMKKRILETKEEILETQLPKQEETSRKIGETIEKISFSNVLPKPNNDESASTAQPILSVSKKVKRSVNEEESYRHLLKNAQPSLAESYAAMLRGNQRQIETTRKPMLSSVPTGTTELDLHVAESFLIPGDNFIAIRCGGHLMTNSESQMGKALPTWPNNCVPDSLEAPSTLRFKARVGVNWSGQYTLKLGLRENNLWDAPLHQCGPTEYHNPLLRAHLRRSLGIKFGLFSSAATKSTVPACLIGLQILFFLYRF